ncbi:MAG TPA: hypothetical protein VFD43_13175 [Planctomycetota bacterium]|nr:hypothetical protein [Planctomycetota bacterium]
MKRFGWLLAALVVAVTMLYYLRVHSPLAESEPAAPDAGLARPMGDREALVAGLFQGALLSAQDGVDFAETPGYRRLLYHVRAMSPAEFSERVTGWLDWPDAVAHPALWRGEFVRVRGVAAGLEAVRLHGLDAGIEDVYRGFVAESDGSEAVVFDLVERPPKVRVDESVKDLLDVEGVFYRTVKFESRTGELREIPYLVARTLTVHAPATGRTAPLVVALQVLGVIVVSVFAGLAIARWAGRGTRRNAGQAGFREMFEARLRDGRQGPDQGGKPS